MAHTPTATDQRVALAAERSTSFIDIQFIAQTVARLRQLNGNDGAMHDAWHFIEYD